MRRLQANLTYMFALADRKGKAQLAGSPAYLTPPPLNLQIRLKLPPVNPEDPVDRPADPVADRAERDQLLRNLYKKLQGLYPGVDPKKEPAVQPVAGAAGRPLGGNPNMNAAAGGKVQGQNGNGNGHAQSASGSGSGLGMTPGNMGMGMGMGMGMNMGMGMGMGGGQGGSNQNSPAPTSTPGQTPLMGNAVAPGLLVQQ
jgi:hypothetical protein